MKTKEELKALKEEVETLNEKIRELTPEELDNVVGGSWRTYSDDTYNSLGINPNPTHGQYGTYHPLIRVNLNSCGISGEFAIHARSVARLDHFIIAAEEAGNTIRYISSSTALKMEK